MTRTSLAVIPLVALAITSWGAAATPAAQRAVQGATTQVAVVRSATGARSISYRLGPMRYRTKIRPRCGTTLRPYAIEGTATITGAFTFAGGVPASIYVTPCHAKAGDWMRATLTDVYGHIIFVPPSPGHFTIKDAGIDSQATLTIKDMTTGYSVTRSVWYAY